jgi:hypothetical protein
VTTAVVRPGPDGASAPASDAVPPAALVPERWGGTLDDVLALAQAGQRLARRDLDAALLTVVGPLRALAPVWTGDDEDLAARTAVRVLSGDCTGSSERDVADGRDRPTVLRRALRADVLVRAVVPAVLAGAAQEVVRSAARSVVDARARGHPLTRTASTVLVRARADLLTVDALTRAACTAVRHAPTSAAVPTAVAQFVGTDLLRELLLDLLPLTLPPTLPGSAAGPAPDRSPLPVLRALAHATTAGDLARLTLVSHLAHRPAAGPLPHRHPVPWDPTAVRESPDGTDALADALTGSPAPPGGTAPLAALAAESRRLRAEVARTSVQPAHQRSVGLSALAERHAWLDAAGACLLVPAAGAGPDVLPARSWVPVALHAVAARLGLPVPAPPQECTDALLRDVLERARTGRAYDGG